MTNLTAVSLSGLTASAERISTAASQIARAFASDQSSVTPSAQQALSKTTGGGLTPAQLSPSAASVQESDLARSMVDIIEGRAAYAANVAMIKANDEMVRATTDTLGQKSNA